MRENYSAVLIGINHYVDDRLPALRFAEKDCQDLARILADPEIGAFPPDRIRVLVGEQATTEKIKSALCATRTLKKDEVVLIYFSGHGFWGGLADNTAYLGSYDVNLAYLKRDPESGLRLEAICEEVFRASPAGTVILVIDCSLEGLGIGNQRRFFPVSAEAAGEGLPGGRYAILSGLSDAVLPEQHKYQNGVFAYHLLAGIRREAADPKTGEVTLDRILDHLERKLPGQLITIKSAGGARVTLTSPGIRREIMTIQVPAHRYPEITACLPHHLEGCEAGLDALLGHFKNLDTGKFAAMANPALETIRQSLGADLVCTVEEDNRGWAQLITSGFEMPGQTVTEYFEAVRGAVFSAIDSNEMRRRIGHGYRLASVTSGQKPKACMIIPLTQALCTQYLVICGLPPESGYLQEVFATLIASFYEHLMQTVDLAPSQAEAAVQLEAALIDSLRQVYGHVPHGLYARRLNLFKRRLQSMDMWYQPIVKLAKNPRYVVVDSWEALARDPQTQKVPQDLMGAAEIWGSEFQIELDESCFEKAVRNYDEITLPAKGAGEAAEVRDLAINLFPASLMSKLYASRVREVLDRIGFPGNLIVLEISEKREIPDSLECEPRTKYGAFQEMMNQYQREFGVHFAIDDFGVGHSSVSRLANLNLSHVKLDAEISRQDHSLLTIKYVCDLVAERTSAHSKVILEGVDNLAKLRSIYGLGLCYVQGYAIRHAQPNVRPLAPEMRYQLADSVNQGPSAAQPDTVPGFR